MTEDEKRILEEEFKKAGSVPALLEAMARSQTEEFRQLRNQVEQGSEHPTGDELYNYVLGWLSREESLSVMDHLVLCGKCLREVVHIRQLEEVLTEDALVRADKISWIDKVKSLVSKLSFPSNIHMPEPEFVRGGEPELLDSGYTPGTKLVISVEAPADGYIFIFHCCEETGEVKLVFPLFPEDDPKITAGQHRVTVEGRVEGPPGKHFFKIFWTAVSVIDFANIDFQNEEQLDAAKLEFFESINELNEAEWQATIHEYTVGRP